MKRVNFTLETDDRLRKFLDHYCLEVPVNEEGKLIRVDAVKALTEYQNTMASKENRLYKAVFHRTGEVNQAPYIIVNVGYKRYTIPYEVEVVINDAIKRVIDDAVIESYEQTPKSKSAIGELTYETTHKKRFPYTMLGMANEEGEGMSIPEEQNSKKSKK